MTEGSLWEHELITDTNDTLKGNDFLEELDYEIDVPCPLQWGLLWFSASTNLNRKIVNKGTKVANFREIVNHAIELTCNIACDGTHTPRALFLLTVSVFLCCAHDKDWDLKKCRDGVLGMIELQHSPAVTCYDGCLMSLVAPQSHDLLFD